MNKKTSKKRIVLLVVAAILLSAVFAVTAAQRYALRSFEAEYLGVKDYGTIQRAEVLDPDSAVFLFLVNGKEACYRIESGAIYPEQTTEAERNEDMEFFGVLPAEDGAYPIQNMLHEGEIYRLTVQKDTVLSCEALTAHGTFTPVVSGTPGKRTLKNFLQTALMPMGNVLYVYGGGWDWQDVGSSVQARSIGVSELWTDAFAGADAEYSYKDKENPSESTYPFGAWNQYYYLGLDCSGYVGWTLYNTLYTESLTHSGFVRSARNIARSLAEDCGLGTWSHTETELKPGDIISTAGHIWICLGCCPDGSVVTMECNVIESYSGIFGGGVCFCALSPMEEDDLGCEAYALASDYMEEYYPQWAERYPIKVFALAAHMSFSDTSPSTGVFHWNITDAQNGLADPEGLSSMEADEIMENLFSDAVRH